MTFHLLFIGTTELLLIGGIALLLFGGKRWTNMNKGLRQGIQKLKKGMNEPIPDNKEENEETTHESQGTKAANESSAEEIKQ